MSILKQTPSQTVGPYFAYGLSSDQYDYARHLKSIASGAVAVGDVAGDRIRIEGQVFDGAGVVVSDALIEIWQADAMGRYAHPADPRSSNTAFKGFGRFGTGTTPDSTFVFDTIKPGAIADGHAPHINVIVLMRGILAHAYTRIYFSDEGARNALDPVLNAVPTERRHTLIAAKHARDGGVRYRFDIHMQGPNETIFFDA
jgi:protocatechuate 3,4-dioxygenase, alpha subunit